jgi:ABC-type multidrug transport system fused ATPase/permease subunit
MLYGIGMALLILLEIVLHAIDNWLANRLDVEMRNGFRSRFFGLLLQSEWQGKERYHSGDVLNRMVQDLGAVVSVITNTLPFAVITLVQLVASFLLLFSMDRTLAIVLVLILPFFSLLSRFYVKRMRSMTKAVRESESRIHAVMQESLQHKTIVKTLEQSDGMIGRLAKWQEQLFGEVIERTRFSILSRGLVSMGFSAGYLTAFIWGVFSIQGGAITFGVMTAFLQLVGRIQRPLADLARMIPTLVSALTSTERLIELEELPKEPVGDAVCMEGVAGVRFSDVSFMYADGEEEVLTHLNEDFAPSSMTAVLGETGAGKTTLIRLILALVRPTAGRVAMYDAEREVEVSPQTRSNLVYVPQGNTLFSGTIRDNLLLGRPDATDEQLWEVLRVACAEFVLSLPEGLDTKCGEQGGGLSEGQAQRIAIARSLLRPGSVLLFDEATSALDPDTERRLLERLAEARGQRTVIFITHRPSVLEYCDRVLRV